MSTFIATISVMRHGQRWIATCEPLLPDMSSWSVLGRLDAARPLIAEITRQHKLDGVHRIALLDDGSVEVHWEPLEESA